MPWQLAHSVTKMGGAAPGVLAPSHFAPEPAGGRLITVEPPAPVGDVTGGIVGSPVIGGTTVVIGLVPVIEGGVVVSPGVVVTGPGDVVDPPGFFGMLPSEQESARTARPVIASFIAPKGSRFELIGDLLCSALTIVAEIRGLRRTMQTTMRPAKSTSQVS